MNKTDEIKKIQHSRLSDKDTEILQYCKDMKVLDVGCVGQERSYEDPNWLHNQIITVAEKVVGVDIDREGINKLNKKGYDIRHIDDLEPTDSYPIIVMGDVIEHIGDVESFLRFYANHLSQDGLMVITTPNPFSFRQFMHVFLYGKPSMNEEHTCNLDPITMLEIFSRGGFFIKDFCWLKEQKKIVGFKNKVINFLANIFISFRKYYSQNFMFVVSKGS